ncbi:MAG: hypothetical protein IT530_06500 [Burkholderiales bacterium]|nr:hypothetical protein [Burkholderiales bacterium]
MSRVLLVWELGLGLGHVARMLPLARALRSRGHQPVLALRDLAAVHALAPAREFASVQSPIWLHEVGGLPPPSNFAESLLRFGFHEPAALEAVVAGWLSMFELVDPALIVFDHAPTALLASKAFPARRALFGDGFCCPPATDPWPPYRWWESVPHARLKEACAHVARTANRVLDRFKAPELSTLSELYRADRNFLLTFQELDHYPMRAGGEYCGPIYADTGGVAPQWPLAGSQRLFAYLLPNATFFDSVMSALNRCGAAVLAYVPGISQRAKRAHSGATTSISEQPYDMRAIQEQCDGAVTQAGMGTASAILMAGKPQIMVPGFSERLMLSKRIEAQGAGIVLAPDASSAAWQRALKRLLGEPALRDNAAKFAQRYACFDPHCVIDRIAGDLHAMLQAHPPGAATMAQ